MNSLAVLDTNFSGALHSLIDRPGKLEEVLMHRGVNGAPSATFDTLRVVIERTLHATPELIHDAVKRIEGDRETDSDDAGHARRNQRPASAMAKLVREIDLEGSIALVKGPGMSWDSICDEKMCRLESRYGDGKQELSQITAIEQGMRLVLQGLDADELNNVDWDDMFPLSNQLSQEFQQSLKDIMEARGLSNHLLPIDYSSLRATSSIKDRDTATEFLKRLTLTLLLLDLAIDHLNESKPSRSKKEVCSQDLHNIMVARYSWSHSKNTWNERSELLGTLKLLNMYVKWGPMVLLVRLFRFKYYRSTGYSKTAEVPLTRLWSEIMQDDEALSQLEKKKKAAGKLLLRFALHFGGDHTLVAFRTLLSRLNGFAQAYEAQLLHSAL